MAKTFTESISIVRPGDRKTRISLESSGTTRIGGNGDEGFVAVYNPGADQKDLDGAPSFVLEGKSAVLWIGTRGIPGQIVMFPADSDQSDPKRASIQLHAERADLRIGGRGRAGTVLLFPESGHLNRKATASIRLDGATGDIILRNADAAEDFDIDESEGAEPGSVMVIGEDAVLRECRRSYDRCVAGVIAGAGAANPAIVLGRRPSERRRLPVALAGRVYCKVDAGFSPIRFGDMLTTSSTPGHAMKACDPGAAFGAVIGKSLGSLPAGRDLVPVLVALQ